MIQYIQQQKTDLGTLFRKDMVKLMKKILVGLLLAVMTLSASGCGSSGVSSAEYNALVDEYNSIKSQMDELANNTVSKEEYDAVVAERDELKKKLEEADTKAKEEAKAAEEEAAKKEEEKNKVYNIGESFEADGLKVTLENSELEYWTYNEYYDSQVYGQGKKYVGVDFSVENIGTDDGSIYSTDFDCYADNALCDSATFYTGEYGSISPGRKTSFSLYWKVPEDAKEIEVEYSYREGFEKKIIKIKLQ